MNKTNLMINLYFEQNVNRRIELEHCYKNNMQAGFDEIWLFVEEKDKEYAYQLSQTHYASKLKIILNNRPTFQEYIDFANSYEKDRIFCVMNSDIYIESEQLEKIKNLDWSKKLFVALSRHDVHKSGASTLLDRQDSADTWIWKGQCNVSNALCPLSWPGVDNSLAWKFKDVGYHVVNPSRDIVTKHQHNVLGNNYRENGTGPVKANMICPPPYWYHPPIFSKDI